MSGGRENYKINVGGKDVAVKKVAWDLGSD